MIDYIVNFGETLYFIARKFNITTKELLANNPGIINPDFILPGQVIRIPSNGQLKRTITVNGFTNLNINNQLLIERLPYLTYLSILGYSFNPDGTVNSIDDTQLIQMSRGAGVAPMMAISNTDANGIYSAELAHTVFTNIQLRNTLINNIVGILNDKKYFGLVVNFEYLNPPDMFVFSYFINLLTDALRPLGYLIALAIRMSVFTDQQALVMQIDQRNIDRVIIMSNELAYTFGQTMVMSPFDQMQRTLDAAIVVLPDSRFLLGIPNSSFNWTFPRNLGIPAQAFSKEDVIALYKSSGAILHFDAITRGTYFNYIDDKGAGNLVWTENGHGFEEYLKLVDIYNLAGVSLFTIDLFTSADYQMLNATHDIRKVISPALE